MKSKAAEIFDMQIIEADQLQTIAKQVEEDSEIVFMNQDDEEEEENKEEVFN